MGSTVRVASDSAPPGDEPESRLEHIGLTHPAGRVRLIPGAVIPGTRYRIQGWLGDGAMGVVYEAVHVDLGRPVAIKVLHAEHARDEMIAQTFREEARAATRIGSPYIVEVVDFAELPDRRLLYVMERLKGRTLEAEVGSAPIEPGRLVAILRQVCKALAAAHDAGIVHRDVKPENILILDPSEPQAGGRADRVKVLDFGVAAALGQNTAVQGTPLYMAPEQVLGIGVARQIDIYSLGCVAYELVCGQPPFVSDSAREVLRQHLRTDARPPRELVGADVIPPALEQVILRCLRKRRTERYADMKELEAALCEAQLEAGFASDWDDLAAPEVDPAWRDKIAAGFEDSRAPARRAPRRLLWAFAGAAAAAAVTIGWFAMRPDAAAAVEAGRVETLTGEAHEAAARARFVYPPPDEPDAETAYHKVAEMEAIVGDEEDHARARAGELRAEFADTLMYLGDRYWDQAGGRPFAIDYYAQALLFDPTLQRAHERGGLTIGQLAELKRKAGQADFSELELFAAEPLAVMADDDEDARKRGLAELAARDGTRSATSEHRLEELLTGMGGAAPKRKRARPRKEQSLDGQPVAPAVADPIASAPVAVPTPALNPTPRAPGQARKVAKQGQAALRAGKWAQADKLFHRALALDGRCTNAFIGLSDLAFERGNHGRAVSYAEKAVRISGKNARYRIKLGDAYFKVVRYKDARRQYQEAQELGSTAAPGRLTKLDKKVGG